MKTVVLGICSSISIYKSCEVLRGLQKRGCSVRVIMTKNATRMISPLLFSALSGQKVYYDAFEQAASEKIDHVNLAGQTSLLVIAPATANTIAKLAGGIADDFLSTFYLALRSPVLVAPAMNEAMYFHRQTQINRHKLAAQGIYFVDPGQGYLACEEEGWGRLADPEVIVDRSLAILKTSKSLKGKKFLITAGPTREYLDPVRFLTNRSSGKMGYELAEEARRRGADVVLVSGPTRLFPPRDIHTLLVQSAEDMQAAVLKHFRKADVLIMAAAVSDYRFPSQWKNKAKKPIPPEALQLVPTVDILGHLPRRAKDQIVVGFAAETENLELNARAKLEKKKLDMVVANDVSERETGFETEDNKVSLYRPGKEAIQTEKKSKLEISRIILDEIEGILEQQS